MNIENCDPATSLDNTKLGRQCLTLIGSIALRGARAPDPEIVGKVLQKLTQVLFGRSEIEGVVFSPVSPDQIDDLNTLFTELDFLDWFWQGQPDYTELEVLDWFRQGMPPPSL